MMFKYFTRRGLFFLFVIILLFSSNFCFARNLEISYPTLPSGETITQNSGLSEVLFYIFKAGYAIGFTVAIFSFIISGFLYILSSIKPSFKERAKDRLRGTVMGLVLLLTTYIIITTINPALGIFKTNPLPTTTIPKAEKKDTTGVYLYIDDNCGNNNISWFKGVSLATSYSSPDFGELGNKLKSVKIIQNPDSQTAYFAILHNNPNYWGQCQQVDDTKPCDKINIQASSATIYNYNFNPGWGSVTFYRKPNFDSSGGLLTVSIGDLYQKKLSDLKFKGVPEEEQNCIEWDVSGDCKKRSPPSLYGNNISSIKIDGKYLVVLIFWDPEAGDTMRIWSLCQSYPSLDDKDRTGPRQIKWDPIMNQSMFPNWVVIFPVK